MLRPQPTQAVSCARTLLIACAAAGGMALSAGPLAAQQLTPAPPQEPTSAITGDDFAGITLPGPARRGVLDIAADRAWTWTSSNAQRLLLDQDVRISVAGYDFTADRAVMWVEPARFTTASGAVETGEQIAIYFDNLLSNAVAGGGMAQHASRLLVTVRLIGPEPELRTNLLSSGRPFDLGAQEQFIAEADERLARLLRDAAGERVTYGTAVDAIKVPPVKPRVPEQALPIAELFPDQRTGPALDPALRRPASFADAGAFTYFAPEVELRPIEEGASAGQRALVLGGGVVVQYEPGPGAAPVQLSATRAVAFVAGSDGGGPIAAIEAGDIQGVYLEGDVVATNGDYTLRSQRAYYDVKTDRAVALDAVYWTYDQDRGMPIYMRAAAIRQNAQDQWTGEDVRLANVRFAEPHFSIGASQVTLTRTPTPTGQMRTRVSAEQPGFFVGDAKLAGAPRISGEFKPSVLREVRFGSRSGDAGISTEWDLFTLFGRDAPEGSDAKLILDGMFERGLGVGADFSWANERAAGELFAYWIYDFGEDKFGTGEEIERDGEHRGIVLGESAWQLSDKWSLFTELTYISDEAFVEGFFPQWAESRREFATSGLLRYMDDSLRFGIEARTNVNDFVSNEYLLQSRGFQTEKLPELTLDVVGEDAWDVLTYYSNTRVGLIGAQFHEPALSTIGFANAADALDGFGLTPTDSLGDGLRAAGRDEDARLRFDTRHEIEAPLAIGPVNIVPFVAGRFTFFEDPINDFGGTVAAGDDDDYRYHVSGGVRVATSLVKTYDTVRSQLLDVDRLRHIMEPSVTVWHASTNIEQQDIPVYDTGVESIDDGTVIRYGVRNTFQTKRGGPDHEHSVDWLVLDTNIVQGSNDINRESPFGAFPESRPESGSLGEFAIVDGAWQVTDALAVIGNWDYDMDQSETARTVLGARINHGPAFSTFFEWRDLDAIDSRKLLGGINYEFTRKQAAALYATYSLEEEGFDLITASMTRRFPQWTVEVGVSADEIADRVGFGVRVRPVGSTGDGSRARQFTEDGPEFGRSRSLTKVVPGRVRDTAPGLGE